MISENDGHAYVILRKDLTIPQSIVQACHAVWEIAIENYNPPSLVVLMVKDEDELREVMNLLNKHNIFWRKFREPDLGNTITAICTEPLVGNIRNVFSTYPLWREDEVKDTR